LFGLELVNRLLERALDLRDLGVAFLNIELRRGQVSIDFRNLAPRCLDGRLMLRAVELEDRRSLLDMAGIVNINLSNASVCLRQNWGGPEEQSDVAR
jgi:hypothetical protein